MSRSMKYGLITTVAIAIVVAILGVLIPLALSGSEDEAKPSTAITADATDATDSTVEEAEQGLPETPSPLATEPVTGKFRYGQTADLGGLKMKVDKMKTRNDGYGTIYREAIVVLTATEDVNLYQLDVTYQNPSGQIFNLTFDTEKFELKPGQKLVGTLYTMDEPALKLGGIILVEFTKDDYTEVDAQWS